MPDVDAAVAFYSGKLGFQVWRVDHHGPDGQADFAVLWLERSVVLIAHDRYYGATGAAEAEPRGRGIDTRIMVRDVDAVYERATRDGVRIVHDIGDRPYGLRDFIVQDPWGFRWRFAAPSAT